MGLIYASIKSKKHKHKTKADKEAEAAFKAMQDKWKAVPKFGGKFKSNLTKKQKKEHARRVKALAQEGLTPTARFKDLKPINGKTHQGSTAVIETKIYTGTKVLGVAVVHKSYLAPVFSQQEAEDIAKMRRN